MMHIRLRRNWILQRIQIVILLIVFAPGSARAEHATLIVSADTQGIVGATEDGRGGLERRASLIRQLNSSDSTVLIDTGNFLFGPASSRSDGEVMIKAYDHLHYDVVNISFRDFRFGKETTQSLLKEAEFFPVSASFRDQETAELLWKPFVVKQVGEERVAFLGVSQKPAGLGILPRLKEQFEGISIIPASTAIREWLPKAQQAADRVVLMYYGSKLELSRLTKEFGSNFEAIIVGGIRPHQLPSEDSIFIAAPDLGQGLAVSHLGQGKLEQMLVGSGLAIDTEMTSLLADYVPPDNLLGRPLTGEVIQGGVPQKLPTLYVRNTDQIQGVELAGPWYQGDPLADPPDHWRQGPELWKASHGGRFAMMLRKLKVEEDGNNRVSGYSETKSYAGQDNLPAGYWVYAAPYWYIWEVDRAPLAPYSWQLKDANTGETVRYSDEWKTLKVPPGTYRLTIQNWYGENEIVWNDKVSVRKNETRTIVLRTGVSVVTPHDTLVQRYTLVDAKNGKMIGISRGAQGTYLPCSPGQYKLLISSSLVENPILWGYLEVTAGRVTQVTVDSGLILSERHNKGPLYGCKVRNVRTGEIVARQTGFGAIPLKPGDYSLSISTIGSYVPWGRVRVSQNSLAELQVHSGVELLKPEFEPDRLDAWAIFDAASHEKVLEVTSFKRWGFAPVPPGSYYATADIDSQQGQSSETFDVKPNQVCPISFETLGFSRVKFETPVGAGVCVMAPFSEMKFLVAQSEHSSLFSYDYVQNVKPSYTRWVPLSGELLVRTLCESEDHEIESLELDVHATLKAGETTHVNFDAADVAERQQLQLVEIDWGAKAENDRHVIAMDSTGTKVFGYRRNPPEHLQYLMPAGSVVRVKRGNDHVTVSDLPAGDPITIDVESHSRQRNPAAQKLYVDVVIESPEEGTIVNGKMAHIVGQASTEGPAGATRIAIVLDISGSVDASAGADLDGDGREDRVLDAEIIAARLMIAELMKIEQQNSGTAFQVSLVRFSDQSEVVAPLTRLTDPEAEQILARALDRIQSEGTTGDTGFEGAIETALQEFRTAEKPAPSIVLFMTDGLGSGLHVSGRAGLQDVTLHTVGLGPTFSDTKLSENYLPRQGSISAYQHLALMADVSAPGGTVWAAPKPADVLDLVPELPITEIPEAELKEIRIDNATIGESASDVTFDRNGFFEGDIPVDLVPEGTHELNRIVVTAIAKDGVSQDSDEINVAGVLPWAYLQIVHREPENKPVVPAIEFILDVSGSMRETISHRPKYMLAREVMLQLLSELPEQSQIGLRLFGHMGFLKSGRRIVSFRDPRLQRDSQLIVPIGPSDAPQRERLKSTILNAKPRGKTPLVYSLLQAKQDFSQQAHAAKLVVLVSDGKENCGGKLADVAAAYRDTGIEYTIHVVGFDIEDSIARGKLQRIAQYGGGLYQDAKDAQQLLTMLESAVQNAGYLVLEDSDEPKPVARGVVNGNAIKLKPGRYQIRMKGSEHSSEKLELRHNERVILEIDAQGNLTRASIAGEQK